MNNKSIAANPPQSESSEGDDESDDDLPLSNLVQRKVLAEKINIIDYNTITKSRDKWTKLRRFGKTKSFKKSGRSVSYLKGLYDFDSVDNGQMEDTNVSDTEIQMDEDLVYSDTENQADSGKTVIANFAHEEDTLKSPIITLSSSANFFLSLKNLKRKKSSLLF